MAHITTISKDHTPDSAKEENSSLSTLDLIYSGKVYAPESVLAGWLNLSFFSITTALIFYHMTRVKSLEMDARIAGVFAIILMAVSVCYTMFSIRPYAERIKFVIDQCLLEEKCSDPQAQRLKMIYFQYVVLAIVTTVIELCITFVIGKRTMKLIFN